MALENEYDIEKIIDRFLTPKSPQMIPTIEGIAFNCANCGSRLWVQKDTGSLEGNKKYNRFCRLCGQAIKTD